MIKDLIAHNFAPKFNFEVKPTTNTGVSDTQSCMMKSLISRAGDLSKNNDLLKFALVSIRFPEMYDEAE